MPDKAYFEKMKTMAKITRIICRIAVIASAVGVAVLAVTVIVAHAVSPEHIKPLQDTSKLDVFLAGGVYVPADVFTSINALRAYLVELLARLAVSISIFIVVALHVMGLLKSVENGTPFEARNVTRLRRISIVIIIGSVLIPAVTAAAAACTGSQSLLDVKSYSLVDATLLLCGFLVLILSGVFAYGARLQREYDQTV